MVGTSDSAGPHAVGGADPRIAGPFILPAGAPHWDADVLRVPDSYVADQAPKVSGSILLSSSRKNV
jgi:hypothetical protein